MQSRSSLFCFISILTFAFGNSLVHAQDESISGTVNVTTNVIQSIELLTVQNISFGNVQPGQQEIYINPVFDVNAGFMIAIGTPESDISITYIKQRELTQVDGEGILIFDYEITGNTEENQEASELIDNDNRAFRINREGRFYLWVGGRISLENALPGSYQGEFTIEIEYI
ncbi:MAG: hypothetical protein AAFW89_07985 [Bacteroidota bacterium]